MILYMYYQVETVGQVYMLVSGAPERRPDHAQNVARAALDMVNAVERLSTTYGGEKVMVRIGMCSCLWCSQFTGTKLKAGPKCPSIEAKYSKAVLKFIFLTKVNKICKHDYSSRNMSNDTFPFSVSVIELEFQQIGFLARYFFISFIRKLTQILILVLFSGILGGLTAKR